MFIQNKKRPNRKNRNKKRLSSTLCKASHKLSTVLIIERHFRDISSSSKGSIMLLLKKVLVVVLRLNLVYKFIYVLNSRTISTNNNNNTILKLKKRKTKNKKQKKLIKKNKRN